MIWQRRGRIRQEDSDEKFRRKYASIRGRPARLSENGGWWWRVGNDGTGRLRGIRGSRYESFWLYRHPLPLDTGILRQSGRATQAEHASQHESVRTRPGQTAPMDGPARRPDGRLDAKRWHALAMGVSR